MLKFDEDLRQRLIETVLRSGQSEETARLFMLELAAEFELKDDCRIVSPVEKTLVLLAEGNRILNFSITVSTKAGVLNIQVRVQSEVVVRFLNKVRFFLLSEANPDIEGVYHRIDDSIGILICEFVGIPEGEYTLGYMLDLE